MIFFESAEFLDAAPAFIQTQIPRHQFRLGWRGEDFDACLSVTESETYLVYVGQPHSLEYARIIAQATTSGFAPTLVSIPTDLAEELHLEKRRDFYYLIRTHPFPPQRVVKGASVVAPGECDSEIDKFLALHGPDSAVRPGNPELDFWIVIRDELGHIVAVSAGVTWQSGEKVINSVAVDKNARRRGFGSLVTILAGQQHFANHAQRVGLGVRASNRGALALYRKIGFNEELAMSAIRIAEQSESQSSAH
ncbi:MAG: hypothetical protein RL410_550 [Actinomycetota bacterium]|jgi:ribosomal protein S18 acetylase RimI-like enzyme